jgi:hypothetical protein
MGVPTSEVGYTSATTGRGDHEVHKGHVVALGGEPVKVAQKKTDSESCGNRRSESHTSVRSVNDFLCALDTFTVRFSSEIRCTDHHEEMFSSREFREKQRTDDCTFLTDVNGITYARVT